MQADLTWVHESEGHPSAILFLVHGTFAKPSNWTNSGSHFCQSLLRLLGPDTSIRCFTWSGKNSLCAREKAANRLRGLLIDSVARFPGIKHFVIGHSHGGNIALKSVASSALADVGIVCLSTPILYGLERTDLTRSNNFLFFILSIPAVGAFAFLLTLGHADWEGLLWLPTAFLISLPAAFVLERSRASAEIVAKAMKLAGHGRDQVLFLRFVGDEASLALSTFQALQYVINWLVRAMLGIFSAVRRTWNWVGEREWLIPAVLVPAFLAGAVYGFTSVNLWWLCMPFAAALISVVLLVSLTPILALFALLTSLLSVFVGVLPFGLRLALATMWIEVCVESSPPGLWETIVLVPPSQFPASGLRHGFCYQEESAIRTIVKYVKEKSHVIKGASATA